MFNKVKDTSASPESPAAPAAAPSKRSTMKSKAPSILSNDLVLNGSISSEGEVQLDGSIDGDVRAGSLTIGEEASVNGEVIADTVVVRGRVTGSIRARQVQLASTARIEGDIVHSSLSVESGAFFDGNCRHASDPLSDKPAGPSKTAPGNTSASRAATASPSPSASAGASTSPLDMPTAKSSN